MLKEYLDYWRTFDCTRVPYVHDADRDALLHDERFAKLKGGGPECDLEIASHSKKLHLGLLPAPHTGDLQRAEFILVDLNPGYGHGDYVDQEKPALRKKLEAQIHQNLAGEEFPFLSLDPSFPDSGGYKYWDKGSKLGGLVRNIAAKKFKDADHPEMEARRFLSRRIATLEVMPYKSHTYDSRCDKLHSFKMAKRLINEDLKERAAEGKVLVLITRKLRELGFVYGHAPKNFILYHPLKQARSASTGPNSTGGLAILEKLGVS